MSLSIDSAVPATKAANLPPAPAVSTSDTQSAAPSPKQAPSQAAVAPSVPKDTVQISPAAQAALQESREAPCTNRQGGRLWRPPGGKVARTGNFKAVILAPDRQRHGGIRWME